MRKPGRNWLIIIVFVLFLSIIGILYYFQNKITISLSKVQAKAGMPYSINIVKETEKNTDFRKVLFTGTRSQLVIMNIPVGGEVGEETHTYTEQTLFFLSGTGKAILNGKESFVGPGDVVVVPPGTKHNFVNTGNVPLKIYTVYSPPNHIDGRIHVTKADADKDTQDEAFGNIPK
jgi:mannose-6-phosphate isomerase-like protein (cupin superfamily)